MDLPLHDGTPLVLYGSRQAVLLLHPLRRPPWWLLVMATYAVMYGEELVVDGSWDCEAAVIATYHAAFADEHRRVTGVLVRQDHPGDEWVVVHD